MMKQKDISKTLKVHPSEVSRMLNKDPEKRRKPTYKFALKLKSCLGGTVEEWREANRETLVSAFELILESKMVEDAA